MVQSATAVRPQLFIHLPKTAGTFVRHVLGKLYTDVGAVYPTAPYTPLSNKSERELCALKRAEVVIGHEDYHTLLAVFGSSPAYTIMRNPVDRVISYYNHLMTHTEQFARHKLSLRRFMQRTNDLEIDNLQVRYLCGEPWTRKPDEESLRKAIDNVEGGRIEVGIQELMALTFERLPIFKGAKPAEFDRQNESTFGFTRKSFSKAEIDDLRESQSLDFKLYSHCLERLRRDGSRLVSAA